jgi:ABC-type lipoprotein release transport system permease subunit
MYTIERSDYHNGLKYRLKIKTFKTANAMYDFLASNKNNDDKWRESNKNLKSGIYVYAGAQYINVKNIDPSALAHM